MVNKHSMFYGHSYYYFFFVKTEGTRRRCRPIRNPRRGNVKRRKGVAACISSSYRTIPCGPIPSTAPTPTLAHPTTHAIRPFSLSPSADLIQIHHSHLHHHLYHHRGKIHLALPWQPPFLLSALPPPTCQHILTTMVDCELLPSRLKVEGE